jgi:poly(ADP-ribose) glycohydrolase
MSYYQLFDYESIEWMEIVENLSKTRFNSIDDVKVLISNLGGFSQDVKFKSLDEILKNIFTESELLSIFNEIKQYALKLPVLFPLSKLKRLNRSSKEVEFTRSQTLCLLSHMILCTLKKTNRNFYWVTFENWLTDGRCCAIAYLQTLIHYFRQSFENEYNDFMKEIIKFKCNEANLDEIVIKLKSNTLNDILCLKLNGSIGDDSEIEIDFANKDIGFGITGTQEEMLFGSSPELCISMLFCDTLEENEGISITGARRVSLFNGYGLNVTLKSFLPIDHQTWRNRIVIAIDALDLSDYVENSFQKQIEPSNLKRELVKAYAGFSCVLNKNISTGHWGCGAFNGDKSVKALIQILAAIASSNKLIFYCRGDTQFFERFSNLKKDIKPFDLWNNLLKGNIKDNFFSE